jgi:hypothetical protein
MQRRIIPAAADAALKPFQSPRTQRVTATDIGKGIIRVPGRWRQLFPAGRSTIEGLRFQLGCSVANSSSSPAAAECSVGVVKFFDGVSPDRARSAIITIGKPAMQRLVLSGHVVQGVALNINTVECHGHGRFVLSAQSTAAPAVQTLRAGAHAHGAAAGRAAAGRAAKRKRKRTAPSKEDRSVALFVDGKRAKGQEEQPPQRDQPARAARVVGASVPGTVSAPSDGIGTAVVVVDGPPRRLTFRQNFQQRRRLTRQCTAAASSRAANTADVVDLVDGCSDDDDDDDDDSMPAPEPPAAAPTLPAVPALTVDAVAAPPLVEGAASVATEEGLASALMSGGGHTVETWLRSLRRGSRDEPAHEWHAAASRYAATFVEEGITFECLETAQLTDDDLRELGVAKAIGHRCTIRAEQQQLWHRHQAERRREQGL